MTRAAKAGAADPDLHGPAFLLVAPKQRLAARWSRP